MPPRKNYMPRSTKPMRSKAKAKPKPVHETYPDGHGVTYLEAVKLYRNNPRTIQPVHRENVLNAYRWMSKECTLCRRVRKLEPHHLVGAGCRSHEHANLIALCRECHDEIQSDSEHTLRVWKAKWRWDREHVDWERLLRLDGQVRFEDLD